VYLSYTAVSQYYHDDVAVQFVDIDVVVELLVIHIQCIVVAFTGRVTMMLRM
jgi:hypothetical protein